MSGTSVHGAPLRLHSIPVLLFPACHIEWQCFLTCSDSDYHFSLLPVCFILISHSWLDPAYHLLGILIPRLSYILARYHLNY
jgi:hypothetical protein